MGMVNDVILRKSHINSVTLYLTIRHKDVYKSHKLDTNCIFGTQLLQIYYKLQECRFR